MAAPRIIDGVQKLAQNVTKASKAATASTSKVLASFTSSAEPDSPKRKDKIEELANIFDNDSSGFSSFVEAGGADANIQSAKPAQPSNTQRLVSETLKQAEATKIKLRQLQKDVVAQRATELSKLLRQSKSSLSSAAVCGDIASHLANHPEAVEFYQKCDIVPILLREVVRNSSARQKQVKAARRCLALMGYAPPVKGPGISVLTLDGGGMKGLVLIEVLKQLEKTLGRPLYECFDYVMGVSTGGILALLHFLLKTSLKECEELYYDLGTRMFSRTAVVGAPQLMLNQAFYDSQLWETILKNKMAGATFSDFAGDPSVAKVSVMSSVASSNFLRPFLFRNYNAPCVQGAESSTYPLLSGTAKYKLWQGCRASSAAPFYYDEFKLDGVVYMDGGLLANNPTAFALHESSLLWPNETTNCVVSVGTGRIAEAWLPMIPSNIQSSQAASKQEIHDIGLKSLNELAKSPSLRQKILGIVQAATDTEVAHAILAGTLPKEVYFRLNPFLSEQVQLDECRPEMLRKIQADAVQYAKLNEMKFRAAAKALSSPRPKTRQLTDLAKIRFTAATPLFSASYLTMLAKVNASRTSLKQKSQSLYGATHNKVSNTIGPVRKWLNV